MPADQPVSYACGGWEIDLRRRELRSCGTALPLGSRAFEILELLVEAGGDLVGKYDLMDRVWPGAVVAENALQFHISAIRKAFGPDRALLTTVSGRGYRLLGDWALKADGRADPLELNPAADRARPFRCNLPSAVAVLVGRSVAGQRVLALLSAYRVVTLTGPGGIGKSSLGLDAARTLFPSFGGDCWLVELAAVSDPGLLATTVATTLGLRLGADRPTVHAVAESIGGRKILLVLDNCEHLVDAVAELVDALVRGCPAVSILATSRELLRINGEYVYRVPPLEAPPEGLEVDGDFERYSAVQMFIACMRCADVDFGAEAEALRAIGAICRRLDGMPLAIEFAAARAAVLGPQPVAERLDDRFRLLTAGRRTALPRHQTLRATLDWSYELLPEAEQRLLRRLAVFAGGFTFEAAAAVAGEPGKATCSVVDDLTGLVAKSLVTVDGGPPTGRWRLLETIRAYALEKLAEVGEAPDASRRHATHYRDVFAAVALQPLSSPSLEDLDRLAREIDNLRVALDWFFAPGGDAASGVVLTAASAPLWLHLNLMAECRERIECAVARNRNVSYADPRIEMELAIALGLALTFMLGSVEQTLAVLARGVEIAESLDDPPSQMRALWVLWIVQFNIGRCDEAKAIATRFAHVAERTGDPSTCLVGKRMIGATLQYAGHQCAAQRCMERVLERYPREPDQQHTISFQYDQRALAQAMLARTLWLRGYVDQARRQAWSSFEEAQASAHGVSRLYPLGWAVTPIAMMTGDFASAERAITAMVDLAEAHNATFWKVLAKSLAGKLLIKRGQFEEGLAELRFTLDACDKTGWTVCYPEFLSSVAEGLGGLGQRARALDTIERALGYADNGGERWYVAEALRIKGELLRQSGDERDTLCAEQTFRAALEAARSQGAGFWELRAALSLARLRLARGQGDAARQLIAPVYGQFTEGFETADLRAAKAMLEALPCAL